jgi:outer membrane protein OmpU
MRACLFLLLSLLAPLPAAADLALSGEAKMGLIASGNDVQVFSAARVTAHAYGITDGGIQYGAVLDLDISRFDLGVGKSRFDDEASGGYVYISGGNHGSKMGQGHNSAAR